LPVGDSSLTPPALDLDGPRLAPALDTGIEVQTRSGRQKANAQRRQQTLAILAIAAAVVLITAAIGWRYASDRKAAASPLVRESAPSVSAKATAGVASTIASRSAGLTASGTASATPIFASYKSIKMHLPVAVMRLTEIGFHQAAYAYALRLKTPMKDANLALAAKNRSTGRNRAAQPSGPGAVMTGLVLRMWRSRPGRPDTAVDVGALAGTTVMAPVSGTIVKIKPYLLYGRYPDYEVHIHPDGAQGVDLVMIHLTGLTCSAGDHVDGGLTPIAKVRKLSDKFHDQLRDYTKSPGDHVHIQINNANYPGYQGLIGAITPGATSTVDGSSKNGASTTGSDTGGSDYSQGD
jgi:murein DD-endopeptidase MepM/ murein hydrolase activator NlpD